MRLCVEVKATNMCPGVWMVAGTYRAHEMSPLEPDELPHECKVHRTIPMCTSSHLALALSCFRKDSFVSDKLIPDRWYWVTDGGPGSWPAKCDPTSRCGWTNEDGWDNVRGEVVRWKLIPETEMTATAASQSEWAQLGKLVDAFTNAIGFGDVAIRLVDDCFLVTWWGKSSRGLLGGSFAVSRRGLCDGIADWAQVGVCEAESIKEAAKAYG